MANHSKTRPPAALSAGVIEASRRPAAWAPARQPTQEATHAGESAQGRLNHGPPIAVIDIGSNSVRLVVYEGLTRSPTPIFNEKVLCGLGREVQTTGLLAAPSSAPRGRARTAPFR